MEITALRREDRSEALRLSAQAGWNQVAADWERLIALWPGTCFGGWVDGTLAATGTLAVYPPGVGWVGMILVDEGHRRKGYGGRMMDHLLEAAERQGVRALGLDASDQGRPVYLRKGFVDVGGIDRWVGKVGRERPAGDPIVRRLSSDDVAKVCAFDVRETGVDRSRLLRRLSGEAGVEGAIVERGGEVEGFAFRRLGRVAWHVGPVVARNADGAGRLLDAVTSSVDEGHSLLIDVIRGQAITAWLQKRGFRVARRLTRMERPAGAVPRGMSERVVAASAFELG